MKVRHNWFSTASLLLLAGLIAVLAACSKKEAPDTAFYFQKVRDFKYVSIDSMGAYLNKLAAVSDDLSPEEKSYFFSYKGYFYKSKSSNFIAKTYCEKALEIAKRLNNDTLLAIAYNGIGLVYKNFNEFDEAVKNYMLALGHWEKVKDYHGIAVVNINLATMYQEKEDAPRTEKYLDKTLEALKVRKDDPIYLSVLHLKANLMGMSGNTDSALKIDNYAIRMVDSLNLQKQKSQFLNNMALCYFYTNQLEPAETYLRQSVTLDSTNGDLRLVADSYIYLSKLKLRQKLIKDALLYNQAVLQIAKQTKNTLFQYAGYDNAASILFAQNDYANAMLYKDSVIQALKKMTSEKRENTQLELTEIYESEKKDQLLTEQNHQLGRLKLIFLFIALVVFLVLLSGYLYFKNYQKITTLKLEKAIEETNQNERLRISRDLHDNMGAYATSLLAQIDSLELSANSTNPNEIKELRADAENIMSTLRETIWILKTRTISASHFFELVKVYAGKHLSKNPGTTVKFNEQVNGNKELSPAESLNLYRIVQEVIQNILKHAGATEVEFNLSCNGQISIAIHDNGKGFNPEQLAGSSGLDNMRYRAGEIHYNFALQSAPGQGTTVTISEKQRLSR